MDLEDSAKACQIQVRFPECSANRLVTAHASCHPSRQGRTQARRAVAAADSESLFRNTPVASPRESFAVGRRSIDRDAVGSARRTPVKNGRGVRLRAERNTRGPRVYLDDSPEEAAFANVYPQIPAAHRTVDLVFPFWIRLSPSWEQLRRLSTRQPSCSAARGGASWDGSWVTRTKRTT